MFATAWESGVVEELVGWVGALLLGRGLSHCCGSGCKEASGGSGECGELRGGYLCIG